MRFFPVLLLLFTCSAGAQQKPMNIIFILADDHRYDAMGFMNKIKGLQTPIFSVRTDRYKYIYYNGVWDINELFDLQNDPFEMNNLIRDPAYRKTGLQLKDELFNWLRETNGLQIPLKKTLDNRGDNLYKGTY